MSDTEIRQTEIKNEEIRNLNKEALFLMGGSRSNQEQKAVIFLLICSLKSPTMTIIF